MKRLIGLLAVDGHNFPNLALMKLSTYHKVQKDRVRLVDGKKIRYDILYTSKVFTFTPDIDLPDYIIHRKGGTGYKIYNQLPDKIEHLTPDYALFNCEHAYGFLTRGCIRKCPWCIVPAKEGLLREHADITEFIADKKSAVLLDNNVLASDFGLTQIEKIIRLGIKVDFNQGLDARIIAKNKDVGKLLARVKWLKPLRMACDTDAQMDTIATATAMLRKYGATPRNYFIYVLAQELGSALRRINFLKSLNLDAFCQPYINFEDGQVDRRLKQLARWCNLRQLRNVSWDDYEYGAKYVPRYPSHA
jgi:hypothetical protein